MTNYFYSLMIKWRFTRRVEPQMNAFRNVSLHIHMYTRIDNIIHVGFIRCGASSYTKGL